MHTMSLILYFSAPPLKKKRKKKAPVYSTLWNDLNYLTQVREAHILKSQILHLGKKKKEKKKEVYSTLWNDLNYLTQFS